MEPWHVRQLSANRPRSSGRDIPRIDHHSFSSSSGLSSLESISQIGSCEARQTAADLPASALPSQATGTLYLILSIAAVRRNYFGPVGFESPSNLSEFMGGVTDQVLRIFRHNHLDQGRLEPLHFGVARHFQCTPRHAGSGREGDPVGPAAGRSARLPRPVYARHSRWKESERSLRRAIEQDPNRSETPLISPSRYCWCSTASRRHWRRCELRRKTIHYHPTFAWASPAYSFPPSVRRALPEASCEPHFQE
jgi:hypothetical protein